METGPLFEICNSMTRGERYRLMTVLKERATDPATMDDSDDLDQMMRDCAEAADFLEAFIEKFSPDRVVSLEDLDLPTEH